MTNQPEQYYDVVDAPSFLARSKKAIAGGVATTVAGVGAFATTALQDGAQVEDLWQGLAWAVGAFFVGFVGVWVAPKNATPTPVEGNGGL